MANALGTGDIRNLKSIAKRVSIKTASVLGDYSGCEVLGEYSGCEVLGEYSGCEVLGEYSGCEVLSEYSRRIRNPSRCSGRTSSDRRRPFP